MPHELLVQQDAPLHIGATGMESLTQNIRIIVITGAYSVPFDREFAHLYDMVDSPAPHETIRLAAQLTEAIEKYEPRVKVESISFEAAQNNTGTLMEGRLTPRIRFRLREGVQL